MDTKYLIAVKRDTNDELKDRGASSWKTKKRDNYYAAKMVGDDVIGTPINHGNLVIDPTNLNTVIDNIITERKTKIDVELNHYETDISKMGGIITKKNAGSSDSSSNKILMRLIPNGDMFDGYIVTKIGAESIGLYSFKYVPKYTIKIKDVKLIEQDRNASAEEITDQTVKDIVAVKPAATVADERAKQTILEILHDITQSSAPATGDAPASSANVIMTGNSLFNPSKITSRDIANTNRNGSALSRKGFMRNLGVGSLDPRDGKKGGKRNTKGNRKTQKKRKTQPKKKPKKKSVRKTSKK